MLLISGANPLHFNQQVASKTHTLRLGHEQLWSIYLSTNLRSHSGWLHTHSVSLAWTLACNTLTDYAGRDTAEHLAAKLIDVVDTYCESVYIKKKISIVCIKRVRYKTIPWSNLAIAENNRCSVELWHGDTMYSTVAPSFWFYNGM